MFFYVKNTVILLVLLVVHSGSGQVSRDKLFPFGQPNGDTTLDRDENKWHSAFDVIGASSPITLKSPFTFFNTTHPKLYVNGLGNILFNELAYGFYPRSCDSDDISSRGPMIAPFWSVIHPPDEGHIHYRETTDPSLILRAHDEVMKGFPDVGADLSFKSIFLATWDNVPHYRGYFICVDDELRNTFQAILASDEKKSFVIFYYNELTWTLYTHEIVGSTCVQNKNFPAVAGFTAGSGHPFHYVLGDCMKDVLKITDKSNVNELGKWVFRVDEKIENPNLPKQDTSNLTEVVNQTENNNHVHSVSSEIMVSTISFYFCVMLASIARAYILLG